MDEKTSAIAIKNLDYLENDKMVLLYSLEHGKISVIAKGVKKQNARLKYAVEPFCFGQYMLNNTHERYILTGCNEIESFFSLRENVEKFYVGNVILDIICQLEVENQSNPQLFLLVLKSLQKLVTSEVYPRLILTKFILDYLSISGYQLNFNECSVCHTKNFTKLYLDVVVGGTACVICRSDSSFPISLATNNCLKILGDMPFEKIHICKFKEEYIDEALNILNKYIAHSLGKIKSLEQMLELR